MLHRTTSLIRVKPKDFEIAGIEASRKTVGVRDGFPVVGRRQLDVQNIIWCTGLGGGFSWIDLPIFDATGDPMHEQGACGSVPGSHSWGFTSCMHEFGNVTGNCEGCERIVGQPALGGENRSAGQRKRE